MSVHVRVCQSQPTNMSYQVSTNSTAFMVLTSRLECHTRRGPVPPLQDTGPLSL